MHITARTTSREYLDMNFEANKEYIGNLSLCKLVNQRMHRGIDGFTFNSCL